MNALLRVRRILILAANPTDTGRLRLDEEVRSIQDCLKRSTGREQVDIISQWAVRTDDLQQALQEYEPSIVHFSGHGTGEQGVVLDDGSGHAKLVSAEALAWLFKLCPSVECVLLNACYSEVQARAIAQHVDYVIGMNQAIGDRAAIQFAKGFYRALGNGRSIPESYNWGLGQIKLEGIPEESTPVLLTRAPVLEKAAHEKLSPFVPTHQPTKVFISYRDQDPDRGLARQFYEMLQADGHQTFMAAESIAVGEPWQQRIYQELNQCDYFLLLLSPASVTSEMVTEEVKQVKQLRDSQKTGKPVILPIRVQFSFESPLNYELRGYLESIQQRLWQSETDTNSIVQEVRQLIGEGGQNTATYAAGQPAAVSAVESVDLPPLPVAEPELQREPGGSVPLKSGLYVERPPIEADCFAEILQPGALIRIRAPRQMGKTSLMARVLNHAREQGCQTIPISFQVADSPLFMNLDSLLRWFCEQVGRRLKRLKDLDEYWIGSGSKDKCKAYFEDCLLTELGSPLVLGLDEVDRVFPYQPVADDFFALLRFWYEAARYGDLSSELWENLRVVVVHSTEPYVPLNINQSPFNVGKRVELPEFTPGQVQDLAQRYGLSGSQKLVESLMALVGGHPYLVRKALYHLRRQDVTLAFLQQSAHTEAGIYSDHLRRHLLNLQGVPTLPEALRQVVTRDCPVDIDANAAYKLESMGLIALAGNSARPRCEIYRQYFRDHLLR
jgi:serine/threonine-protein kinase